MQLSPELTDIVGKSKATRGEITKLVFSYIRRKQLLVNRNFSSKFMISQKQFPGILRGL